MATVGELASAWMVNAIRWVGPQVVVAERVSPRALRVLPRVSPDFVFRHALRAIGVRFYVVQDHWRSNQVLTSSSRPVNSSRADPSVPSKANGLES